MLKSSVTTKNGNYICNLPNKCKCIISGVPGNFVQGGGGSTNSIEDRENGDLGGGSPLIRGSGGSCNLVQEISFHIVKFS